MKRRQKRILLAMGWYDHRVCQGIGKYAVEAGWHLCADITREKVIPWGWQGDGILAWLGAGDDLAEFVTKAKLPTVDFSYRRPHLPFPRVLCDHTSGAQLAAEHFLAHGLRHFLYYSSADNWTYNEIGNEFKFYLKKKGHNSQWIKWHESPAFTKGHSQWQDKSRWLAQMLKTAPKPLAVFAATDDDAVEVMEACEKINLAVPEEVSLIGVNNSLLAVEAMHTPISSLDRNLETVGYRGAELLDKLMQGKPAPREPLRVPPTGLIARKSSDLLAVNHPGVARSLRYLWENFHRPIGVDDLVRVAAMSRSALHQAFLEHIGRPPGRELHRIRIEQAKKILAQSNAKLEVVAEQCGYQSGNSFWLAFKHTTGISPKQFQKQFCR
jgi:LacI family transcriptional regulator